MKLVPALFRICCSNVLEYLNVYQWRSQDLELGAQGVWDRSPQRGPGSRALVTYYGYLSAKHA